MSRTIRAERPWFQDTRHFAETGLVSGRPSPRHRADRRPRTADGRFSDAAQHDPHRNRRARRAFKAGNDTRGRSILKEW